MIVSKTVNLERLNDINSSAIICVAIYENVIIQNLGEISDLRKIPLTNLSCIISRLFSKSPKHIGLEIKPSRKKRAPFGAQPSPPEFRNKRKVWYMLVLNHTANQGTPQIFWNCLDSVISQAHHHPLLSKRMIINTLRPALFLRSNTSGGNFK